jgi:CMP-N-acetylneuraminic acid synthetase
MIIKAFLPCRSGSERVKNKNIRKFYKYKFGLVELKLNQLLKVKEINQIILSTDDKKIIDYANSLKSKKITINQRPKELALSITKTDDLINYVSNLFNKEDHVLWTHVTSPFFDEKNYSEAIKTYKKNIKKYDTLIGANIIQDFIFDKTKPYNYNPKKTYWPNTQTLKKLYKINNTIFLTSAKIYLKVKNRIGKKLFFYNVEKINSIDIDNIDDFNLSEKIVSTK